MSKGKLISVECLVCKNKFLKGVSEIKRYPRHCCSTFCRSKLNDKRVKINCKQCSKEMFLPPSKIALNKNKFCSKECHDLFQITKKLVPCHFCGTLTEKHPCYIARSRYSFCSQECRSKYSFEDSFVETEFEKLVQKIGVHYLRNDRTIISPLELDFYFPDLKFAVEINGNAHYKPIYGDEALASQKARDKRKRKACRQLGIKLRTIKPGNCKTETYLPRYKQVIREIKKLTQ